MLFQKSENKTSAKNSTDLTDKKISTISTGPFQRIWSVKVIKGFLFRKTSLSSITNTKRTHKENHQNTTRLSDNPSKVQGVRHWKTARIINDEIARLCYISGSTAISMQKKRSIS